MKMCDVAPVNCNCATASEQTSAEFAALDAPQQCDEPMPPYKDIRPIYDGHFTDTFPQLDAVSFLTDLMISYFIS